MTLDSSTHKQDVHQGQQAQRDALARRLCARIASDRRTASELQVVDELLGRIERGDCSPIEATLETHRFDEREHPGDYVRGWNAAMREALTVIRIERGLTELRRQSQWPDEPAPRDFDASDVGGER